MSPAVTVTIPCFTCAERGKDRPATRIIAGTPMCDPCWRGEAVHPHELFGDLPREQNFVAERVLQLLT